MLPSPIDSHPTAHFCLDVGEIHKVLLLHKDSLEELVIQGHNYGMSYNQFPKIGSFEDFTSLARLGRGLLQHFPELPLPPALNSVAVRQCSILDDSVTEVLLYLGKHASLKSISIDNPFTLAPWEERVQADISETPETHTEAAGSMQGKQFGFYFLQCRMLAPIVSKECQIAN